MSTIGTHGEEADWPQGALPHSTHELSRLSLGYCYREVGEQNLASSHTVKTGGQLSGAVCPYLPGCGLCFQPVRSPGALVPGRQSDLAVTQPAGWSVHAVDRGRY